MIDENNTYFVFIPINFSHNCNLGQYYDSSKYFFCWGFFSIVKIEKRPECIQCSDDEFTINQNELCEKCVEGGRCINGSLFNQESNFSIFSLWKLCI